MKLTSISGILLAYHEEDIIENSINRLASVLSEVADKYEIIIVGFEGCKDKTNQIVEKLGQADPRIRLVIQKREEKGYGRAYAIGIKAARHDWVFQSDADGQYDFNDIKKLAAAADNDVALVHGYRARRHDPIERLIMAFCYNLALKFLYFIRLKDIDSAFKLIRTKEVQSLPLESKSGFCVAESVIRMQRQGLKFKQMPITHLPRTVGEALSEKGIKNPFGLQLPNFNLVSGTLGEMFFFRFN